MFPQSRRQDVFIIFNIHLHPYLKALTYRFTNQKNSDNWLLSPVVVKDCDDFGYTGSVQARASQHYHFYVVGKGDVRGGEEGRGYSVGCKSVT